MHWMQKYRLPIASLLVLLAALGWVGLQYQRPASEVAAGSCQPAAPLRQDAAGSSEQAIAWYQERIKRCPDDQRAYSQLGLAYLQRASTSGDPSYYSKADALVSEALRRQPDDYAALTVAASLAAGRHDFQQALELSQRGLALAPQHAPLYGVLGDAQTELGRYDEAIASIQRMVDLRPDLSSYTRVAYLRELHGDLPGAFAAMRQALESAGTAENSAWVLIQLGNLYFNTGQLADAEQHYRQALALQPDWPQAQAGVARVHAARGDYDQARQLYQALTARFPLPEYVIALGELELAAGQPEAARQQFELLQTIDALYQANGVQTDLEMALFLANHGAAGEALARAQRAYEQRPNIHAADALAWALHQHGDYRAARQYSREALRLKTQDALMLYHAGMIAIKDGDSAEGRQLLQQALKLNPFFSVLYAAEARQTLARLQTP